MLSIIMVITKTITACCYMKQVDFLPSKSQALYMCKLNSVNLDLLLFNVM